MARKVIPPEREVFTIKFQETYKLKNNVLYKIK